MLFSLQFCRLSLCNFCNILEFFSDKELTMCIIGKTATVSPPRIRQTCIAVCQALGITASAVVLSHAVAAEPDASRERVFTLGEITVTAKGENEVSPLAPATLDSEQLQDFSRDGLAEALNLIPGVSVSPGSGSRNEANFNVRGFERWRVPLLLDGIRVYLPADNRIDFDRFLTPDLSKIEVSKGYVSVLNGPDGMGGAINLVTRKPVKPFEGEVRASAAFSNDGHYNGNTTYANLGTRQDTVYFQASVEQRDLKGWYLSDDFKSTSDQDSDKRTNSGKKDWRVNLKAGFTPNATDDYSINFIKQEGEKHAAYTLDANLPGTQWDWPKWDVWNLYWLSKTQLGDKSYIKTRAYYNKFDNDLVASNPNNSSNNNWTSTYDDSAYGASVELGTDLLAGHTIKGALHLRRDNHTEYNHKYPAGTLAGEPKQDTTEDVLSLALEETWHITPQFDLVIGLSRDKRHTRKAQEYTATNGVGLFALPIADSWATNYQGAAIWRYRNTGNAHFSISDRTRFPTMFERYSSRFGSAFQNPWLKPERAVNIELGIEDKITSSLAGSVAIFHNRVHDAIHSVTIPELPPNTGTVNQNQNVGNATYKGIELGITATPLDNLEIGANYTYLDTKIKNPTNPGARLEATPRHKGFLYVKWQPTSLLTVIPALELSSDRLTAVTGGYKQTGSYELLSLKIDYKLAPRWNVSFTGRNLLDKNYELTYGGYPQEGRNFLLSTQYQF
jgi:iron complex outermembrane receptor protein